MNKIKHYYAGTLLFRQQVVSPRANGTAPMSHIDFKMDMSTAVYCYNI